MVNYLNTEDVIVAQCTSDGSGAINIIRISGRDLETLYKKITCSRKKPRPNTIVYKNIYINNKKLDHSLVSFFKTPNSFTGEDIIEINCHGGDFIAKNIIKELCNFEHARHALPGEFSFRAYNSGKIDILQAESINELINGKTNVFANKSLENIDGMVSKQIKSIKSNLIFLSSQLEYDLDVDESELENNGGELITKKINEILSQIKNIASCSLYSNIIKDGVRVVLLGKPNVGKSTMFNYLLGIDRSIVSNAAGTTRDSIEAVLEIAGHRVIIVDTAGYWKSKDKVEIMGIKKTQKEIDRSDIVLFLGEKNEDINLYETLKIKKESIKILSKSDKNSSLLYDIEISSLNGSGFKSLLTLLSTKIKKITEHKEMNSSYYINNRQQKILSLLMDKGNQVIKEINIGVQNDIIAELVKELINILNEIIDPIKSEDVINNIFSNFCVGK